MKRLAWLLAAVVATSAPTACSSETQRPATKGAAIAEANATLESLGLAVFDRGYDDAIEWAPPDGCDAQVL